MRFNLSRARLSAIVVTAGLVVSACGGSSPAAESSSTAETASSGPATGAINVWTWSGAPGTDAMDALASGFESSHPGVTVNVNELSRDDFKSKVPLALNSGEAIDVLGVQPNLFASQIQDQLRPVSEYQDSMPAGTMESYTDQALDQTKKLFTDGELYAVPFGLTGSAVGFYNADILGELGLEPPQTWDDMQALSDALKTKMPDVVPAVMPAGSTDAWFQDEFVLTMVGQTAPDFFDSVRYDGGPWNTPEYLSALEQYKGLYDSGALSKNVLDLGYADAMQLFNQGKAAIVFNGSWEAGMLSADYRTKNQIDISSVGVMPVPAADPETRSLRSFLDITWGIPQSATNVPLAAEFIAYATAGDGVKSWANSLGFVPAIKDFAVDATVLTTPEAKDGYAELQKLIAAPHSDRNNLSAFSDVAGKAVLQVVNGQVPAAEAVESMQSDLDSGKYN